MNDGRGIKLENACFRYAENGWSLEIPELRLGTQSLTCIVGPNGAGKSTLLRLAAGILKPDTGIVRLGGQNLCGMPRRMIARQIGFLPQETPPLFDYTVEMVARMGRYAYAGWLGDLDVEGRQAVDAALAAVGLQAMRERPLSRLSGGERRQALIAAVLAQTPGTLLLDEPTAALDIHHAVSVMRLLADLGESGRAVVIVTHDLNLAAMFAERLLVLVNGRVIADGQPGQVVCNKVLRQVYGNDVLVVDHPETGGPLVVAQRQADAAERRDHA